MGTPRAAQNRRAQGDVGRGRRITALGPGRGRSIRSQLYLAAQNSVRTARRHEQQNKVGGLPAKLQSEATAFQRDDRRRAPRSIKFFTGAAGHHAAALTPANADRKLDHRWQYDDASRFIEKILGNIIRYVQNFLDDLSGVFHPLLLFLCIREGTSSKK
jgi:hypothetical protein